MRVFVVNYYVVGQTYVVMNKLTTRWCQDLMSKQPTVGKVSKLKYNSVL